MCEADVGGAVYVRKVYSGTEGVGVGCIDIQKKNQAAAASFLGFIFIIAPDEGDVFNVTRKR